ncbi:MAG: polysaccharide deacetylase family protein, partial [Clostridiales bacterium]|nr:polysaccharide deacetylase family protein [Clostridiales bacterium]
EPYEKCIALTFDDGPNPLTTPALLEGLAKYNAKATFFVLGHRLDSLGDIVRQAAEAGHEIGNHTFNHLELTSINKAEIAEQIDKTSDILFDLTGQEVTLLRPPYGLRNETLIDLCNDRNLTIVLWNVDTRDWDHQNAQKVTEHIVSHAQDGAIMLMHDIYESTIEGTIEAVRQLSEDGWRFVTVDELIAMKSGDIIVGGIYRDAFGTVEK